MTPKKKVYIAGPISLGDTFANVHTAMSVWEALLRRGFVPFCPHWSAIQHMFRPSLSHQEWMDFDLEWLANCHYLLRLPGESRGADMEVARAIDLGIPVVRSIPELEEFENEC